jgi:hypothetical protein
LPCRTRASIFEISSGVKPTFFGRGDARIVARASRLSAASSLPLQHLLKYSRESAFLDFASRPL